MKLDVIYNKDCLEGMKTLPDKSVDLVITSPPFNLGNDHHTGSKRHYPYPDSLPENEYQDWQLKVLGECYRVLKTTASLFYHHKNRIKNGVQISPYEWLFKTQFVIKQEIVWINGTQNFDKVRFYPFTERVYWLAKDRRTKIINKGSKKDVFNSSEWPPVGTKEIHTRAFPCKMVWDLLLVLPDANIILDPFAGSGTTLVMAKRCNRQYIGYEINKEYCKIIEQRLEAEKTLWD